MLTPGRNHCLGIANVKKQGFIQAFIRLTGFPDAILTVYPKATVQLCIVHMVRNPLKYVSWKDYKAVTAGLKRIYQSLTESEARRELMRYAG